MTNQYIQDLIRQYVLENAQNNGQYSFNDPINDFSKKLDNISNIAQKASDTGKYLNNHFSSPRIQNWGSKMTNAGDTVANGVNTFKGFATKPFEALASKFGTGAATTAATTGGTVAGSTAGATAAGAGAGTAAGSAAGGAAAGGAGGLAAAGPIGAIIALAIKNRQVAKKSGLALMDTTNKMAEGLNAESEQNLAQLQQNNAALQQQANQALSQGIVTGGAAPIQNNPIQDFQNYLKDSGYSDNVINGVPQGLNYGNQEVADWINQYNNGAGKSNPIRIPLTQEDITAAQQGNFNTPQLTGGTAQDVNKGWLDKLANGIADFALGYNENRHNGFTPENLEKRIDVHQFKNGINPTDYTTPLNNIEQVQFNKWANDMKAKGIINPNDNFNDYDMQGYWKNEVLNNTNLANGNAQTHFTDKYKKPNHETFSNESIYAKGNNAKYAGKWDGDKFIAPRNENKMTKFGEFAGTVGRIVQNPTMQALVAGGLSTALTGNPLYGLGMAYKFGKNRAMSDIYAGELAKHGVDVVPGMWGSLTSKDMDTLMEPQYKEADREMLRQRNDDLLAYRMLQAQSKLDDLDERKRHNLALEKARLLTANASMIRANKVGSGRGGHKGNQHYTTKNDTVANIINSSGKSSGLVEELRRRDMKLRNGKWIK